MVEKNRGSFPVWWGPNTSKFNLTRGPQAVQGQGIRHLSIAWHHGDPRSGLGVRDDNVISSFALKAHTVPGFKCQRLRLNSRRNYSSIAYDFASVGTNGPEPASMHVEAKRMRLNESRPL
jgi:hypothetical protein